MLGGRGAGKTRAGAEWLRQRWLAGHITSQVHGLLVAPTPADARDIMVDGPSGIRNVGPLHERPTYEPTKRLLTWPNGALAHVRSGAEPDGVRGLNIGTVWMDEPAAWKYLDETFDNANLGLRVGEDPRGVITGTPKPLPLIRQLASRADVEVSRSSTWENQENLAPAFFRELMARYEGTRLGQQEVYAQILDEAEGALWKRSALRHIRVEDLPPLERIVVGVDPAISKTQQSNETGIVVAARYQGGRRGAVLADYTVRASPEQWARKVMTAFHEHHADRIIYEANQGGDMVAHTIRTVAPNAPCLAVHATQGKRTRAEPIAALYEQGRIDHVGVLEELENQLCTWEPLGQFASPDRLDAAVWALTALFPVSAQRTDVTPPALMRGE